MGALIKPATAGKLLDRSASTIRRWLNKGYLDGVKLPSGQWAVDEDSVEDLRNPQTKALQMLDKALGSSTGGRKRGGQKAF